MFQKSREFLVSLIESVMEDTLRSIIAEENSWVDKLDAFDIQGNIFKEGA